jgi:hypothetical protein
MELMASSIEVKKNFEKELIIFVHSPLPQNSENGVIWGLLDSQY